jgi:hypothetical protein
MNRSIEIARGRSAAAAASGTFTESDGTTVVDTKMCITGTRPIELNDTSGGIAPGIDSMISTEIAV